MQQKFFIALPKVLLKPGRPKRSLEFQAVALTRCSGKKTAGETQKNSASFCMGSVVSWRFSRRISETIDSVLKIGTRSFCLSSNYSIKAFNSSTP